MDNNKVKMLNKLCTCASTAVFSCALSYLVDKGYEAISGITDEEIEAFEGNGLMTAGFVQAIAKTAREITRITDNSVEVIQYCQIKGIFDVSSYKVDYHVLVSAINDLPDQFRAEVISCLDLDEDSDLVCDGYLVDNT